MINPLSPLGYLFTILEVRWHKARSEEGASAVEWVLIAAIVVGICIAVAGILRQALEGKANEISSDIEGQ
jgi:Flp pilus assembly pilin Flp